MSTEPDAMQRYLDSLPIDDEPLTQHEIDALEEWRRNPNAPTLTTAELMQELGLDDSASPTAQR